MLAPLLICLAIGAAPSDGAAPANGAAPIVRFDAGAVTRLDLHDPGTRRKAWDTLHLLAALQGLANRTAPRLYLRFIQPADDYWWAKMTAPGEWLAGRPVVDTSSLDELLTRFRDVYHGAVVYDESVAALSLLASTVAGCEDLLPVRFDAAPDSLYQTLVASGRLPLGRDLRGVAHSKTEAYRWAREHYLVAGGCDATVMAYYVDQYWLRATHDVGHANACLTNHDWFVARRGFFFDLDPWDDEVPVDDPGQPVGEDSRTMQGLLKTAYERNGGAMIHVGGFVPWAWKYTNFRDAGGKHEGVPTEWRYAEILSAYNAYMDADALGPCGMANASFYQHFPLRERYPQHPRPTESELMARGLLDAQGRVVPGTYVQFYVGDYDSAAWLYQEFPHHWDDRSRGTVPLAWAVNPNLEQRMAPALHYAHLSATPADWFVAGDSGAGYLNPGALQEPRPRSGLKSGLAAWVAHCRPLMARWDLSIVGFVIDGFAPGLNEQGLDAYAQIAPDGIVGQKIGEVGLHGTMPYVRMSSDVGGVPEEAAKRLAPQIDGRRHAFLTLRTVLVDPGWHKRFWDALREARPKENIQVVDPYTFFFLVKRYVERREAHRGEPWPRKNVVWTSEASDEGLTVRANDDGPFDLAARGGVDALHSPAPKERPSYVYFAVNERFHPKGPVRVSVEYLDLAGRVGLEYDAADGPYTYAGEAKMGGSGQWKTAVFDLPRPSFERRENAASDFRLINFDADLWVRRVEVSAP
jgi:hypothetical protein